MKALVCLLFLAALILTAADLTGKWRGKLDVTTTDGDRRSDEVYMDFRVDGNKVTGTVAINPDHPFAIRNGKLEAGKLTFEALMEDPVAFDLVLDGNTIHGTATTGKGDEKASAKVELKRVN